MAYVHAFLPEVIMQFSLVKSKCALALLVGGILAAGPVLADKPEWAGGGNKGGNKQHSDKRDEQRNDRVDNDRRGARNKHAAPQAGHFGERHNVIVRDYYAQQMRDGHCPPGLAKKNNGCMPPGQAKKWEAGRRLPANVKYYQVPQPLVTQIGTPPAGHRYIRVGNDILLVSNGTGIIIDVIKNFGRG